MRSFPPLPDVRGSHPPDDLLDGHLWLLELIDGTGLRFRMDDSGLLRFGSPETMYPDFEAVPLALRPAVRRVRERFDREALREAVDDPESVVFFGVATHHRGTGYDWDRLPPFLGTDVWIGSRAGSGGETERETETGTGTETGTETGAFRPPDAAAAIFDGVGLDSINAVEREVNARDFDPDGYDVPESAWRDGPAAGIGVRNKRGGRGLIPAEHAETDANADLAGDRDASETDLPELDTAEIELDEPEAIAATYATGDRFERVIGDLERRGAAVTVDAVADGVVEAIARETPVRFGNGGERVNPVRVRAAVIERTRAVLDER